MRKLVTFVVFSTISSFATAQPEHPGYSPTLFLASASEVGGKIVIQPFRPGTVPPPVDRKEKPGERYATEWVPLRKVTLGETVHVFGTDGKPVAPQAVLKALAKPKGVAIFQRSYDNDPQVPHAFYRDLLREGTLILVARHDDLFNPKP